MSGTSPRITKLSWGRITTDAGTFRDAKLWPGGGRNWDWNETGTQHAPGVQADDVAELLEHGTQVVVIGRGQQTRLGVTDAAVGAVQAAGATCVALPTHDAIARYLELVDEGVAVGALIHTTC